MANMISRNYYECSLQKIKPCALRIGAHKIIIYKKAYNQETFVTLFIFRRKP